MSWLYATPLGVIAVATVLLVLGALEVGHQLGRRAPVADQQSTAAAVPILGLIGLLIAFSFGMAGERHAIRRAAAVEEANAIGTFWLRTFLLPDPTGSNMRARVRRYVDVHFEHREAVNDQAKLRELEAEAGRLQHELWALLVAEARPDPDAGRIRLVAPALNEMIDSGATILAARENRVPDAIFIYLFCLAVVAGLIVGYRPRSESRNLVLWGMLTLVLSGVLLALFDLDRPRRGLIQSDVTPYVRLRESMQRDPAL